MRRKTPSQTTSKSRSNLRRRRIWLVLYRGATLAIRLARFCFDFLG